MNDRSSRPATGGEATCPELGDLVDATRFLGADPRATMAHLLHCDSCGDTLVALSEVRSLRYDLAGAGALSDALARWADEAARALDDTPSARSEPPASAEGGLVADGAPEPADGPAAGAEGPRSPSHRLDSLAARVALSVAVGACGAGTGFGAIKLLAAGLDVSLAATVAGTLASGLVALFASTRAELQDA